MNHYAFHIGDYASHTRHLSLMEDLAFRRLLDHYYLHERPLNGSSADVARVIGMRDHVDDVAAVLKEFFQETSDGWANLRAEAEIEQYRDRIRKAAEAGKASGRARAKKSASERMLNGRSTDLEQTVNPPVPSTHRPVPEPKMDGRMPGISPSLKEDGVPTPVVPRTGARSAGDVATAVLEKAQEAREAAQLARGDAIEGEACPNTGMIRNAQHGAAQALHRCPDSDDPDFRCECCTGCEALCKENRR